MHVGINAQLLSFSQNYRNGGISHHIRSLLTALAKWPGKHEYTVFVNGQDVIERLAARHAQITYVPVPWPEAQPTSRIAWEQFTLPSLFRQKHGLSEDFLLYLGTLEPRKNITTLIEAYAYLRRAYARTEKLILAGGKGWFYEAIYEKIAQLGLQGEVIFPGFVAESEQKLWYSAASAFVYPSLYEGFGLPVVEALACGIPVVTSNVSSLPEAGSDIALCVEPYSVEAMAEALYKALTDQAFRQRCRAMAAVAAQRFSAQAMAERTVGVYEQAAALHSSRLRSRRVSFV